MTIKPYTSQNNKVTSLANGLCQIFNPLLVSNIEYGILGCGLGLRPGQLRQKASQPGCKQTHYFSFIVFYCSDLVRGYRAAQSVSEL